jgi:hypothetical protein
MTSLVNNEDTDLPDVVKEIEFKFFEHLQVLWDLILGSFLLTGPVWLEC